jgi:hypothetical protein
MIMWPADLPQRPSVSGFSKRVAETRLMTPMDAGPPKVRRRITAAVRPVSVQFDARMSGVARFERFWEEEAKYGAEPFLLTDPLRNETPILETGGLPVITPEEEAILVVSYWLCLFGEGAPTIQPLNSGVWFSISFQLNVMP